MNDFVGEKLAFVFFSVKEPEGRRALVLPLQRCDYHCSGELDGNNNIVISKKITQLSNYYTVRF